MSTLYYIALIIIVSSLWQATEHVAESPGVVNQTIRGQMPIDTHCGQSLIPYVTATISIIIVALAISLYILREKRIYRFRKLVLIFFLAITPTVFSCWIVSSVNRWCDAGKLASTCGLLMAFSGFVQLDVCNFFGRIMDKFSDIQQYPYGPPSHVTRDIIDNPDAPIRTFIENMVFYNERFGFFLIVLGTLLQIVGVWQ
jgi:hypothetical protein